MMDGLAVIALGVIAVGCAATDDELRARAAFDMQCSKSKLHLVEIDEKTSGVEGCGQRATYVQHCEQGTCNWILNSESKPVPKQ